jgi:hypothetical protein
MIGLQCEKCGQALALAETQCPACGTPVPSARRMEAFLQRAEGLAEEERFAEAAKALDPVLSMDLDAVQGKTLWRKKGVWLRKASQAQPQWLDGAEAALAESLRLDDHDDLSHQIWIDLLVQRNYAEKARLWYRQRLELNPEDAMAKRQLAILKLAADFKSQPPQRPSSETLEPDSLLWRLILPTSGKAWTLGFNGLFCSAMLFHSIFSGPAAPAAAAPVDPDISSAVDASSLGMGELFKSFDDPWAWGIQALLCWAYVAWYFQRRSRRD